MIWYTPPTHKSTKDVSSRGFGPGFHRHTGSGLWAVTGRRSAPQFPQLRVLSEGSTIRAVKDTNLGGMQT